MQFMIDLGYFSIDRENSFLREIDDQGTGNENKAAHPQVAQCNE